MSMPMGQTEMERKFFSKKREKYSKTATSFRVHFLTPKTGPHDVATTTGRTEKWSQKLNHGMRFFFPDARERSPQVTTFFVCCNWPIACVPHGKTPVLVDMDETRVNTDLPYNLFRGVAEIAAGPNQRCVQCDSAYACMCVCVRGS